VISDWNFEESRAGGFQEKASCEAPLTLSICLNDFESQFNSFPVGMTLVYETWPTLVNRLNGFEWSQMTL
jgi:hypothetical protein